MLREFEGIVEKISKCVFCPNPTNEETPCCQFLGVCVECQMREFKDGNHQCPLCFQDNVVADFDGIMLYKADHQPIWPELLKDAEACLNPRLSYNRPQKYRGGSNSYQDGNRKVKSEPAKPSKKESITSKQNNQDLFWAGTQQAATAARDWQLSRRSALEGVAQGFMEHFAPAVTQTKRSSSRRREESQDPRFRPDPRKPSRPIVFYIPPNSVNLVIGTGGATVRDIQEKTRTKIQIPKDSPGKVTITGQDREGARRMIEDLVSRDRPQNKKRRLDSPQTRRKREKKSATHYFYLKVEKRKIGWLNGKNGSTVKTLEKDFSVRILRNDFFSDQEDCLYEIRGESLPGMAKVCRSIANILRSPLFFAIPAKEQHNFERKNEFSEIFIRPRERQFGNMSYKTVLVELDPQYDDTLHYGIQLICHTMDASVPMPRREPARRKEFSRSSSQRRSVPRSVGSRSVEPARRTRSSSRLRREPDRGRQSRKPEWASRERRGRSPDRRRRSPERSRRKRVRIRDQVELFERQPLFPALHHNPPPAMYKSNAASRNVPQAMYRNNRKRLISDAKGARVWNEKFSRNYSFHETFKVQRDPHSPIGLQIVGLRPSFEDAEIKRALEEGLGIIGSNKWRSERGKELRCYFNVRNREDRELIMDLHGRIQGRNRAYTTRNYRAGDSRQSFDPHRKGKSYNFDHSYRR